MTDATFDRDRSRAFTMKMMGVYGDAMLALMVVVGQQTGLLPALADGPGTATQLAERTGLNDRYVLEWLRGMTVAGVLEHSDDARAGADATYVLPPEHAISLTGDSFLNTTAIAEMAVRGGGQVDALAQAFRDGHGDAFHEQLDGRAPAMMGRLSRARYDTFLVGSYLTSVEGLSDRLDQGITVADVGCGTGRVANLIAQAHPASTVIGVDLSPPSIEAARAEAAQMGLDNVTFQQSRIEDLQGPLDVVTAFDVIHDLGDPGGAVGHIRSVLADDGLFLMCDSAAPASLAEQAELPWAPMMYGLSLLTCVGTARSQGGEGLGNMWGQQAAEALLADAGFGSVEALPVKGDPMNALYAARP